MIKGKSKPGKAASERVRENRRVIRSMSDGLRADINGEVTAKREREAANRQRKEEAAKKSEIVQVVSTLSLARNLNC